MAKGLKELSQKPELLSPGHRMCAGCSASIAVRQVLLSCQTPVVVSCSTGCLEVATTIYPYTAWRVSFIHSAFENSAATIAGVEAAYQALKKRGKIKHDVKFIGFGGDGGSYDIGFQAISGALERGHDILYICYDNQAYMNTGIQRSSATPRGAGTTTSPAGNVIPGKPTFRKDLTECIAAHDIPYVAQTAVSHWRDLTTKVEKGLAVSGPAFLNILAPCTLGWGFPPNKTIEMARLAVETCFWPLYEVSAGKWKLNYTPKEKLPIEDFLKRQRRFQHLFTEKNKHVIRELQEYVDKKWQALLEKTK
jgi:pyruvate ferredoxin oxidoreductase beta subunit